MSAARSASGRPDPFACSLKPLEIHDAVLIAAAFSMFNRYVDGLATFTPEDPAAYDQMGRRMASEGYIRRDA